MILIAGYQIIKILRDYQQSDELYEETVLQFATEEAIEPPREVKEESSTESTDDTAEPEPVTEPEVWSRKIRVDLEKLQEINADIVGWLYFENEDISYPILFSGDNTKYLRTSYTMKYMTAGSIFLDGRNLPDFSDQHSVIYGHNMKNLSMFGRLRFYRQDADYYKDHEYFQIITNEKYYRYQIFAYKEVSETSDIYRTNFESEEDFGDFIVDEIRKGSYLNSDVETTKDSQIITLSTCTVDGMRFAVSAVRVDEADRE